jgi:hypothetical protein
MMEREKLEREIHQLTQIIGSSAFALASRSTLNADRARLQKQIEILSTLWAGLLKQLSGASSLSTADLGGPYAQAKEPVRSEAHQGGIATDPVRAAHAHQRDQANAGEV